MKMKNCCDQAIKGSQDWYFGVWMQEHYLEIVEEYQNTFKG